MRAPLLLCAAATILSVPLSAAELKMPVWKIGQSWTVACPGMAQSSRYSFISGVAKSVKITVGKDAVLGGKKCRVLEIVPQGLQQGDIIKATVHAWYRAKDLALLRVKIGGRLKDGGYTETHASSPDGRPIWDIDETRTYIPLQMPPFPLAAGAERTCFTRTAEPAVLKSHPSDAGIVRKRAITASASGSGPIIVSFRRTDQPIGKRRDEPLLEQVWSPRKPWWTTAKRLSPSTGKPLFEYDLTAGGKSFVPTTPPDGAPPVPYLRANEDGILYADFPDEDGIDMKATKLLVDKVDYIKWAENHGDYLNLLPIDDVTPDFDTPHDIDYELRDTKGNCQLVGLHKHLFGRSDPGDPTTITIAYRLYRDGPVLIRICGSDDGVVHRRTLAYEKRGDHSFTWDGTDDFGSACPDPLTLFEIGYADTSERIAVLD